MKKLLFAGALAGALMFSGCATTPGSPPPSLDQIIAQVQAISKQACKFIPTAATIAEIVSAGTLTGAFVIANAICAAVTAQPLTADRRMAAPPIVAGVVVRGRFVQ